MGNKVDCVIIGYNDVPLEEVMRRRRSTGTSSGPYRYMRMNVLNDAGRWKTIPDFLSESLFKHSRVSIPLNVMEMPNLGVCYLASFLRRRGKKVEFVNSFTLGKDRLSDLLEEGPSVVAITTTFYVEEGPIREIVNFVKSKNEETCVVVGGPWVYNVCAGLPETEAQDYIFASVGADVFVYDSQGEATLNAIVEGISEYGMAHIDRIPNLIYRLPGSSFTRTLRQPESNAMDENAVDWSLFDREFLVPTIQTRTARSCAFSCSFCSYPAMAGALSLSGLDAIERELRQLKEAGVRQLVFIDDTFNVPLPRFKSLLQMMIRKGLQIEWYSYFRCSNSDTEAFDLMAQSGCKGVFLGIESGDQHILELMNKHAAIDKYRIGIRELNARGILTFASFVVGFPGETRQSVENSIQFINEARPVLFKAEPYYHSTNLPVHSRAKEAGLTGAGYSWHHATMDWTEAFDHAESFYSQIRTSIPCPGYMFDFWALPYLSGKGISTNLVTEFLSHSRDRLGIFDQNGNGISRPMQPNGSFDALLRKIAQGLSQVEERTT